MTDFLNSLKADLTDRRLLPVVAVVLVAFVAAIAYAVLGGGSASTPTATLVPIPAPVSGIAATQVQKSSSQAVAETTNGSSIQTKGAAHNPFQVLPAVAKAAAQATSQSTAKSATSPSSKSTSSSSSGSSSKSTGGGEASKPAAPSKPSTPAKPKTLYKVAAEFGVLPPGTLPANAELHAYAALSKSTPLPTAKERVIEFVGVIVSGSVKSATFALSGEVIIRGDGSCLPSAAQCKMIELKEGKTEQLEYLSASGQPVTYELRVVSIASSNASTAAVRGVLNAQGKAGPLTNGGLLKVSGLRFSSQPGVLVFAPHPASAARAHGARRGARG